MGKKKNKLTWIEAYKKVRKDWGALKPGTKIVPNKKRKESKEKCRDRTDGKEDEVN
jgi:hypothetical protein